MNCRHDGLIGDICRAERCEVALTFSASDWNRQAFSTQENGQAHRADSDLFVVEKTLLTTLPKDVRYGRVLDLGVGTGRTVPHLAPHTREYIGIDYSEASIAEARKRFPNIDLRVGDARNIESFAAGQIDLVFFSYNGIDYVDHRDRTIILSEVYRVMRNSGYFIFSFHNINYIRLCEDRRVKPVNWLSGPIAIYNDIKRKRLSKKRNSALQKFETISDEYAIINDSGMNFGLMTYYTSMRAQKNMLITLGFLDIEMYSTDGSLLNDQIIFDLDYMIYVVARK